MPERLSDEWVGDIVHAGSDGYPHHVVSMAREIDERRTAERLRQDAIAHSLVMLESLRVGDSLITDDDKYVAWQDESGRLRLAGMFPREGVHMSIIRAAVRGGAWVVRAGEDVQEGR